MTTAISIYFRVTVDHKAQDGLKLGSFTQCDGLGCEMSVTQREEGGVNDFVHQLPGRLKYGNVTLARPISKDNQEGNQNIVRWLTSMTTEPKRTTALIEALSPTGELLVSWVLGGVIPVKWKGPSFSLDTNKVATESLELAHHGFLPA